MGAMLWLCVGSVAAQEMAAPAMQPIVAEPAFEYGLSCQPLLLGEGLPAGAEYATPLSMSYGVRSFTDAAGEAYYPVDLLPVPTDPTDIQVSDLLGTTSVRTTGLAGPAGFRESTRGSPTSIVLQHNIQGKLGVFYDTGFAGGAPQFAPRNIAVDGTDDSRRRGQLLFVESNLTGVPLNFELGAQLPDSGAGRLQAYTELLADDVRGLDARRAFVRVLTPGDDLAFVVGKNDSLFGDKGAVPHQLSPNIIPIGAVGRTSSSGAFDTAPQINGTYFWRDVIGAGDRFEIGGAIEDQNGLNDIIPASNSVILNRYPALVSRLRYSGFNRFDSYQVAAMVRPLGVETASFDEVFESGWGASGVSRFRLSSATLNAVYLGIVGGEGVGGYIFNGTPAAAMPNANDLLVLRSFGTYAGYQHYWYVLDKHRNLSSNILGGFVQGDSATALGHETLIQGASNLLWNISENVGLGVEYQYGHREIGTGATGDNHRILMALNVSTGTSSKQVPPTIAGGAAAFGMRASDGMAAPAATTSDVSDLRF
jgi:hypothetical protein